MPRVEGPSRRVIARRGDEFAARLNASIRGTLRAVVDGFDDVVTVDDLTTIMREWTRRVDSGLLEAVGQAYADAAHGTRVAQRDELVKLLGANGTVVASATDSFEIPMVTNAQAADLMAGARNRLVNVGNEVWELARSELLAGLQAGEGIERLRARVVGATNLASPRAGTIARTEISHAMNQGSLAQMRQIDAPGMLKEWIAARDGRTRPSHARLDGQRVAISQHFIGGLEPGEEPNCRCTLGFDLPDDELVTSACDCGEGEVPLLASAALVATIGLGPDLGSVCACDVPPGELFASKDVYEHIRMQALDKIANAPAPSAEAVAKAQRELERARAGLGRAGGESRGGSAAARRKQRLNLFKEFGGEERGYIACHGCGIKVHWAAPGSVDNPLGLPRFERGKIFVKCQGGGYQLVNLLPECFGCNRSRNDKMVRNENRC